MKYIYVLTDPRDDIVRYIGVTSNVHQRRYSHRNHGLWSSNTDLAAWICDLHSLDIEPRMIVLEEVPDDQGKAREEFYIVRATDEGWPILNHIRPKIGSAFIKRKLIPAAISEMQLRLIAFQKRTPEERGMSAFEGD